MECSEPGVIRDEELMAYLAGEEVRPVLARHLVHCQRCQSLLETYRRIDVQLTSALYRWDCPSNLLLGEYQLDLLDGIQAAMVEKHLQQCVLCNAEQVVLAQFLAQGDPEFVAPIASSSQQAARPTVADKLYGVQEKVMHTLDQSLSTLRRVVAVLLPQQPRLAFQRDATTQNALWPRSYAAESIQISLQIEDSRGRDGTVQLIGFVARQDAPLEALQGIPVQLMSVQSTLYSEHIDELGNFVFSSLPPATYTLELQLPEHIIVIDKLTITAPQ